MQRRGYCAIAGALLTGVAGCSGLTENQTSDETEAPSSTETPAGEPDLSLEELSIPERVEQPNADVPITVGVMNTGTSEGVFSEAIQTQVINEGGVRIEPAEIELTVPSEEEATKTIDLDATGSGLVEFQVGSLERQTLVYPADPAPRVRVANLISEYSQYGDVVSNSIQRIPADTEVFIGVRYEYLHVDAALNVQFSANVYNSEGEVVGDAQAAAEEITDQKGWGRWEQSFGFTSPSNPGEYSADLVLRDPESGAASSTLIDFTVTN